MWSSWCPPAAIQLSSWERGFEGGRAFVFSVPFSPVWDALLLFEFYSITYLEIEFNFVWLRGEVLFLAFGSGHFCLVMRLQSAYRLRAVSFIPSCRQLLHPERCLHPSAHLAEPLSPEPTPQSSALASESPSVTYPAPLVSPPYLTSVPLLTRIDIALLNIMTRK